MKPMAAILVVLAATAVCRADAFDDYDSVHLAKAAASPKHSEATKKITREDLIAAGQVLPKVDGVFLIVHTNDNRWAKLLVHPAAQKAGQDSIPLFLIERFVTYKEAEERTRVADGKNVRLFPDFRFSADIGAIVPEKGLPADLRFVHENGVSFIEPLGKAEIFLVSKHLAEATPVKGNKIVIGPKFDVQHFTGKYTLYDDGKAPSELQLVVTPKGEVSGFMFSGATGAKYEVTGSVGPNPLYGIFFNVQLPRSSQTFTGWMFTGDASAIAGYSRIENRESGFYAVRDQ